MWLDRSISITEKVMLAEIDSLETPDRGCYASNQRFAEFFGLSPSRVSEIVKSLERRGRIRIDYIRQGKQIVERRIRMVFAASTPPAEVFGKPKGGYSENAENPIRKTEGGYSENTKEREPKEINSRGEESMANKSPPDSAPPKVKRVSKAEQARLDGIAFMVGNGVSAQHAADLMTNRKGDALTVTAWERLCAQGDEVGMTPAQAVEYAAGAGWKSFTAEYFRNASGGSQRGGQRVSGRQAAGQAASRSVFALGEQIAAANEAARLNNGSGYEGDYIDV